MTYPLLLGDKVPASAWTNYTPVLTASSSNPTLGSGAIQTGRWIRNPLTGLITVQARIQFGTSGVNAGSGTYFVSLPVAPNRLVNSSTHGNADAVGQGSVRDNGTTTNNRSVIVLLTASGSGDVVQFARADTSAFVTSTSPFTWDTQDGISFTATYLGG